MYQVALSDPESPEGRLLLVALSETLRQITGSSGAASFDVSDVKVERACFAIARSAGGDAVGCGAFRPLQPGVAELKRMFAMPGSNGAGSAVLAFLERKASEFGYGQVWLETRKVNARAVAFYERHGYRTIASFGRYVGRPEAVCLGKYLPSSQTRVAWLDPHRPDIRVQPLDHSLVSVAERIHAVQIAGYTQEAMLIGAQHFPPLARTLEDVRWSSEQFFGAYVGNELAGTASIESGGEGRIGLSTLVVAPEWHRRGVGGTLLHHIMELHGDHEIQVQTAARNFPALALYRRSGFVEVLRWFVGAEPLELVALRRPPAKIPNIA